MTTYKFNCYNKNWEFITIIETEGNSYLEAKIKAKKLYPQYAEFLMNKIPTLLIKVN